jgi:cell division protein FtsX
VLALKLAFRPWRLQPFAQIATFATLGVLLFLAGLFGWLSRSLPTVRAQLEGDRVASVFIDPSTEATSLESIRDQIRVSVGSSAVKMEFVSSDRFLETLAEKQPELAKEVAALGGEKEWIAPKHFTVRGEIAEASVEKMRRIPGVESVSFSERRFRPIVENLAAMEWLCRLLVAATLVAMVAVLFLLGRINSGIFEQAEAIVAQLGGSDWQARFPSRASPFLAAFGASVVAAFLFRMVQPGVAHKIGSLSPFLRGLESAPAFPVVGILAVGAAAGLIATFFAPAFSRVGGRA